MSDQLPEPQVQVVKEAGDVRIHTFVSHEAFLANATHIIESPNALVLVDGQFIVPFALQYRAFADSLGKPIERVYLSHAHIDHYFGLGAAFGDVDVYALPETIAFLEQSGEEVRKEGAAVYGGFVPDKLVIPGHTVSAGTEVIDGVTYEHVVYTDAEADFQLAIRLPELGVFITQDLIYSGAHIYLTENLDNWISTLREIGESEYEIFLPGHGMPADKNEIGNNINYLQTAQRALAEAVDAEAFKATMVQAFPERNVAAIFDIYLPLLFG
jgi:glyoxylase-like metal-dependent hydrolase (beta-lactamase superfamily II)